MFRDLPSLEDVFCQGSDLQVMKVCGDAIKRVLLFYNDFKAVRKGFFLL
jgi:hypothetical protein